MRYKIRPVILCGGTGSRLWPISRESYPKQYLTFDSNIEKSFLQMTIERFKNVENIQNPIVICNEEHRFIAAEQLRKINVNPNSILLEPFGRNTAPAIALAALRSQEDEEDSLLLIMPSDHKINNLSIFLKTISIATEYANNGNLLAFGISPKSPETGYGYIKSINPLIENSFIGEKIEKFIEKPTKDIAEKLILNKKYSWNSGIYLFKSSSIINEIKKYSPEIINYCQKSIKRKISDLYFEKIDKNNFQYCPNISIDKAVMEKTTLGIVFSLDIGWSDIGGWNSFWENSKKDQNGNVINGESIAISTSNSLIKSEKRLVVGLGLEDLIVVETNDAVLVAKKSFSEKVKDLVKILHNKNKKESREHVKGHRPWGNFITIEENDKWKVKKIEVNPSASLSLQMHQYRSEHWIIVSGIAKIEIGNQIFNLNINESCYVPKGQKHRLSNPSDQPLIIIEVQCGSYLGEDDIYRFDDDYGRST